jgi:hypothetical protein
MATNRTRKRRGAKTQALIAEYLRPRGWPFAEDAGAGRRGLDILGTPGLAIEVKARRDLQLPKWLRQAAGYREDGGGLPIVVHRPDGFGEASIDDWPATLRLTDLVRLLRAAGYGDPADDSTTSALVRAHRLIPETLGRAGVFDHPYQGEPDGLYCTHGGYADIDQVDFCTLPRSAHKAEDGVPAPPPLKDNRSLGEFFDG